MKDPIFEEIKFAPLFDSYVQRAQSRPIVVNTDDIEDLMQIYKKMSAIAVCGCDEYRNIWFYIPRGEISDFGDYDEYLADGAVSEYADFEDLWLFEYPETNKWCDFAVNEYKGEYYFYIDGKLTFHVSKEQSPKYYGEIEIKPLIIYLEKEISRCIEWLQSDEADYNHYVNTHLSYHRRTGKILRQKFWDISSYDKKMITKGLRKKDIETLNKITLLSNDNDDFIFHKTFTAGAFFEFCKMGYVANNYFKGLDLSGLEMYNVFADGRHEGLTELDLNSAKAFSEWYHDSSRFGGHPWEVCRGGNSTHISLYVHYKHEKGWFLRLAGNAASRVNETVKFAVALFENKAPFILSDAKEIYKMVCGTDYIGIVPSEVFPRYCHSLFSHEEENIIDFMNLGWEDTDKLIEAAEWYPVTIKKNINSLTVED